MKIDVRVPVDVPSAEPLLAQLPAVVEGRPVLEIPGRDIREKLANLERALQAGETMELPVRHHFSRGVYARELFIPKGTVLVGKIHKFSQINIVSQGEISVLTDDGVKRVKAPFTLVSGPGIKRAGYAHEDTIWTTIHGTHETDLEALEDELIAASFEDYDRFVAALTQGE